MKIAVIGAGGRTGTMFVRSALAAGHDVQAGVLHTNHLEPHPKLAVSKCDATSIPDLMRLLAGQEAVVSAIGHVKGSPADVQTQAIRSVITAMHKLGIRRVVSLTGTGVRMPGDHITTTDYALNTGIRLIDPKRIADGIAHAKELQASGLDWTLVRVLKLTDSRAKNYTLTAHGPAKTLVPREEAAQAMLNVLEQGSFIGEAPIISRSN